MAFKSYRHNIVIYMARQQISLCRTDAQDPKHCIDELSLDHSVRFSVFDPQKKQ